MKNKLLIIFIIIFFNTVFFKAYGADVFNFDVTEVEILKNRDGFI